MEGQGAKCQVRIARATEHFRATKVLSAAKENNSYLFFALFKVLNLKLLESQKEAEG